MCLYNEKARSLQICDASRHTGSPIILETPLLCAVVSCHDDQIFYLRLQKPSSQVGLYRRLIQGMKISSEVLVTAEIREFDPKAKFSIACREEDSAQILIVLSTQGKYQSHRLDFEARSEHS
jgi:hypothetical protein